MSRLRAIHLASTGQLRASAPAWDDLWSRSEVATPTARAEPLALWLDQFTPTADFSAVVVEDDGPWVAALPLAGGRIGGIFRAGVLPGNAWSAGGELLVDPAADIEVVLDRLVAALGELPWCLLWLDEVVPAAPRWQALLAACDRAGVPWHEHERFQVGRIEIGHDWEQYKRGLSRSHRQAMAKAARRLEAAGPVHFALRSLVPSEVEDWLRRGFAVEDRSWKGAAGSSVLCTPGMFDFFFRQARQLAAWEQLEAATLELDGRPIAFAYGAHAKGVYHPYKIGYDPSYAEYSPGQLLFYYLLEWLHNSPQYQALDFMGPLSESTSRWRPDTYAVGRIVIAPRRLLGRIALQAYHHGWRRLRRLKDRRRSRSPAAPRPRPASLPRDDRLLQPAG
jgi:CelD/BcsL family acetyltransferase involved in cellulose biosynthesis